MNGIRLVAADRWDRFAATDPGLIRLLSALSTVCAIVLTLGVLAASRAQTPELVAGALATMVSMVAITEPGLRDQSLTLAVGLPTALAALVFGAVLASHRVVADAVFVVLIFGAIYVRRFGPRAGTLGVFAFQLYFVSQFIQARVDQIPQLGLAVLVAFGSSATIRLGVLRTPPERTLERLRRSFRIHVIAVLDVLIEIAQDGPEASQAQRTVGELRRRAARLHTAALMIQSRLEAGTKDKFTATVIQRHVAEAETSAERLSILVLRCLWPGADVDTLTTHLAHARPAAGIPGSSSLEARDVVGLPVLISELQALRVAIGPVRHRPAAIDVTALRSGLLSYRYDERLPDTSPAMQDVFRAVGDFANAVIELQAAADGIGDSVEDGPHEPALPSLPAQEVTPTAANARPAGRIGVTRPSTRTAFQVATGSVLAIVGGELLSPQRWYWAVFTCWVVYIGTTSTGEILIRGYRRLVGTVVGVIVGFGLASLIGGHTWVAFALAILSVFGMYFTTSVSYTLMSFFVTTMIGMLYTLLHTLTPGVLLVRIEETALGIACGLVAALVVLPVRTRDRTDRLLLNVLQQLRTTVSQTVTQLDGVPAPDLLGQARTLDAALNSLRLSVDPLINPFSPLRARRRTVLSVMGRLETAVFHTRSLATTAQQVHYGLPRVDSDPALADEARRVARRVDGNLLTLTHQVAEHGADGEALVRGGGFPLQREEDAEGLPPNSPVGEAAASAAAMRRASRHLSRLDEGILGLAQPLGVPVRGEREDDGYHPEPLSGDVDRAARLPGL